jgi:hypothetical protein
MANGLVGDVRAATMYFTPLGLEIPFEILPPSAFQTGLPEALARWHL